MIMADFLIRDESRIHSVSVIWAGGSSSSLNAFIKQFVGFVGELRTIPR